MGEKTKCLFIALPPLVDFEYELQYFFKLLPHNILFDLKNCLIKLKFKICIHVFIGFLIISTYTRTMNLQISHIMICLYITRF